jgi:phosphatidylserine/phosphatidylglycerophosphate/cardiolipin synthase-like enzyme
MAKWDPDHWFLDANNADIAARRAAWTRIYGRAVNAAFQLDRAYTSGNNVQALVDGENYMGDLCAKLNALTTGDVLLITGWEFSKKRFLDRNNPANTLLHRLLRDLIQNQVAVGLIAFNNPIPTLGPGDFIDAVNKAQPGAAVADGTTIGTAHHEKVVFVGRSSSQLSCAYVGGMDLSVDRMDNNLHNRTGKEERQWGWHDIAVRVAGNAIMQIWANFADRWDSIHGVYAHYNALYACAFPAWAKNAPTAPAPGTHHVQVLRTVGRASPRKQDRYMLLGEQTIRSAFEKAIAKAEHYIYIEEQFLWDGLLARKLRRALALNQQLQLIVVMAAKTDMPSSFGKHNFYLRTEFFKTVLGVLNANQIAFGPATRVHAYGLHRSMPGRKAIYVHSKLMIIDDRYVAVGSANVNERSMYIDTEMTLGVVDANTAPHWSIAGEQVSVFARDLRKTLWQEHSGVAAASADPMLALEQCFPPYNRNRDPNARWPTTEALARYWQHGHLRCYMNLEGERLPMQVLRKTLDRATRTLEHD